jgi:hypothetical protein
MFCHQSKSLSQSLDMMQCNGQETLGYASLISAHNSLSASSSYVRAGALLEKGTFSFTGCLGYRTVTMPSPHRPRTATSFLPKHLPANELQLAWLEKPRNSRMANQADP